MAKLAIVLVTHVKHLQSFDQQPFTKQSYFLYVHTCFYSLDRHNNIRIIPRQTFQLLLVWKIVQVGPKLKRLTTIVLGAFHFFVSFLKETTIARILKIFV